MNCPFAFNFLVWILSLAMASPLSSSSLQWAETIFAREAREPNQFKLYLRGPGSTGSTDLLGSLEHNHCGDVVVTSEAVSLQVASRLCQSPDRAMEGDVYGDRILRLRCFALGLVDIASMLAVSISNLPKGTEHFG